MILQYKGFNNNWCYEQANTIVWSNVWVGKETRDYRQGGVRYNLHQAESKDDLGRGIITSDLKYIEEIHKAVDHLIKEETKCADEIVYLVGDKLFVNLENVCVVTLQDKSKYITYVFEKGVYILNDSGGTVQKIA